MLANRDTLRFHCRFCPCREEAFYVFGKGKKNGCYSISISPLLSLYDQQVNRYIRLLLLNNEF